MSARTPKACCQMSSNTWRSFRHSVYVACSTSRSSSSHTALGVSLSDGSEVLARPSPQGVPYPSVVGQSRARHPTPMFSHNQTRQPSAARLTCVHVGESGTLRKVGN